MCRGVREETGEKERCDWCFKEHKKPIRAKKEDRRSTNHAVIYKPKEDLNV